MEATTPIQHIHHDQQGIAWIDDTNVKVIEVALETLAHGLSPEEIHFQHPHLSLAQIHAALAHYHDHRAAFDALMARQLQEVDTLAAAQRERSPVRRRLQARSDRDKG